MDMTGERFIAAPREQVWAALNDPEVLKACIPGCTSIEKTSDTGMKAAASVKIGPISAKFAGAVTLSDLDPPNGYTISGEGQGGVAGFAKGGAKVALADADGGTSLSYAVNAQVGGKIAQLGARLIDATAKSMADAFFTKFAATVAAPAAPEQIAAPAAPEPVATPAAVVEPAPEAAEAGAMASAAAPAVPVGPAPPPPVSGFGHAEDHDHDPSNPRIAGLPAGVWIALAAAVIAAAIVAHRFL